MKSLHFAEQFKKVKTSNAKINWEIQFWSCGFLLSALEGLHPCLDVCLVCFSCPVLLGRALSVVAWGMLTLESSLPVSLLSILAVVLTGAFSTRS